VIDELNSAKVISNVINYLLNATLVISNLIAAYNMERINKN
jgi:hypothetical protein